uniref:Protein DETOXIFICATION n=2 Tax=Coccolithus braarudii TaxID=221442 RepID=A0A7S0L012_9EUKA|mmetsp:Transcript_12627/g.27267  ORF Transcript_12627/g.27267 Transcript_12627/m.27267 type:complete len:471 (+) Transcript_12627:219-1631(+)|eukprot:CAMPEP_0183341556 /NCGR_PEP_ID=MMETSP0164_2-20130417/7805_1 /TAXON_ID=221442 /ORGANISM="Coccolithus pelagicus ssp braarudi, Strain PLY182g" /LENGTH=470 /DNA_ID=CAMNT_0025511917 /DNA_START=219 /DNA_END=1631 /DNA_ORIENTATION=-
MASGGEQALDQSLSAILKLSAPAIVNNVAAPLAAALQLAVLGHEHGSAAVAAYTIVNAVISFVVNVCNFLIVVVMARVAHALGARDWRALGRTVRAALGTALAVGLLASAGLNIASRSVVDLMYPERQTVRPLALAYLSPALARLPPLMLLKAESSILCGYQHVRSASLLNLALALVDAAAFCVALGPLDLGLVSAGTALAASCTVAATIGLVLVLTSAPTDAKPHTSLCTCPPRDGSASPHDERTISLCELAYDSINVLLRSVLLSGSVLALNAAAAAQGTAVLAAHAVVLQLWMITSYVVDGFADVGTMLGSRLLGQADVAGFRRLCTKLAVLGTACGVVASFGLGYGEYALSHAFTEDAETLLHLKSVWPLLCLLQPCNALVFVYDGLLYATQSFAYLRNALFVGVVCVFAPGLAAAVAWGGDGLLNVWEAKAALNVWRACTALVRIHLLASPWERAQSSGSPMRLL